MSMGFCLCSSSRNIKVFDTRNASVSGWSKSARVIGDREHLREIAER